MTHMVMEDAGWEWADPLYVPEADEEPWSPPDLNVLETYAHPYTVAVLVVAALLALCVAALAIGRKR